MFAKFLFAVRHWEPSRLYFDSRATSTGDDENKIWNIIIFVFVVVA